MTVFVPVHPPTSVPVIVYVLVEETVAVALAQVGQESPEAGDQRYVPPVPAPLLLRLKVPPQFDVPEAVITGVTSTVTVKEARALSHPLTVWLAQLVVTPEMQVFITGAVEVPVPPVAAAYQRIPDDGTTVNGKNVTHGQ